MVGESISLNWYEQSSLFLEWLFLWDHRLASLKIQSTTIHREA